MSRQMYIYAVINQKDDVGTTTNNRYSLYSLESKCAQLLMTLFLHAKAVKKVALPNMSFNEFINVQLEEYV